MKSRKIRDILIFLLTGMFVLVAMAVPVEAQGRYGSGQRRVRGARVGYGGGYYDPAYIQQMISLPDGLAACQIDLGQTKVTTCHPVIKDMEVIQGRAQDHADANELLGTIHVEKGKLHFRPFDDTNARITTGSGGALGAGGGVAVGGAFGGRKGAAVGAVGGAMLAGWLASRHSHNNCLVIEPTTTQAGGLATSATIGEGVSAANSGSGLTLRNESEESAFVYDGDEAVTTLAPGASAPVGKSKVGYRAIVERFNERGQVELVELGRRAEGSTLVFTSEGQRLPESQ